jgi:hypothetical protein
LKVALIYIQRANIWIFSGNKILWGGDVVNLLTVMQNAKSNFLALVDIRII